MLSEEKAVEKLKSGCFEFPPFDVRFKEVPPALREEDLRPDFSIELAWEGRTRTFLVEYKSVTTPKRVEQGLFELQQYAEIVPDAQPLLMGPHFDEPKLERIREEGMHAIDMSGNGLINIPGEWFVYRTGNENKYPSSASIKHIYRGVSSLVGRVFFEQQRFEQVNDVKKQIESCGGRISLSTVSKVLTQLDEEMMIRKGDTIELTRPGRLLEKLSKQYRPPEVKRRLQVKIPEDYVLGRLVRVFSDHQVSENESYESQFASSRTRDGIFLAADGRFHYGNIADSQSIEKLYVSDLSPILSLDFYEEETRFPNAEFLEVEDQRVYFNTEFDASIQFPRCSPLQTYLDLMTGGKRERDAAERIRQKYIMAPLTSEQNE